MGVHATAAEGIQERLADQLHEPGQHDQVGRVGRARAGQRRIPVLAGRVVGQPDGEGGQAGPLGPGQRVDPVPVRADRDHLGSVVRVAAGVDQGLQVGPLAGDQHDQAGGHAVTLWHRPREPAGQGRIEPDGQISAAGRARGTAARAAPGPAVATAGPGPAAAGRGGGRDGRAQPARPGAGTRQPASRRAGGHRDPGVRRDGDLARRRGEPAGAAQRHGPAARVDHRDRARRVRPRRSARCGCWCWRCSGRS